MKEEKLQPLAITLDTVIGLRVVVGLEVVLDPCSQGLGNAHQRYWVLMDSALVALPVKVAVVQHKLDRLY